MRKIDYRYRHKDLDNWVGYTTFDDGSFSNSFWIDYTDGPEDMIIEQYTGLKDSKGVKIYEGDIVEVDNGLSGYVAFGKYLDSDELDRFGWHLCFEDFPDSQNEYASLDFFIGGDYDISQYTVIGNIHEGMKK